MSELGDVVDRANHQVELADAQGVDLIRKRAQAIPVGTPGECDLCGKQSIRLVGGVCAPCRDLHRLP